PGAAASAARGRLGGRSHARPTAVSGKRSDVARPGGRPGADHGNRPPSRVTSRSTARKEVTTMTAHDLAPKEKQEVQEKEKTRPGRTYLPDVDIREDEHALWFLTDMPGVAQEHVDVELHDNVLRLEGRVSLDQYEGLAPAYTEHNVGNYLRRFTLSNA